MKRTVKRLGDRPRPGGSIVLPDLDWYLTSLSPLFWIKNNEASGHVTNYGSDGGVSSGETDLTYAQTGQLGAGEAIDFNGTTSILTFAAASVPTIKTTTSQRWCVLCNADTQGEGTAGTFYAIGTGASRYFRFSLTRLIAYFSTDGTAAQSRSLLGEFSFPTGWVLYFMDYDNSDSLGLGRNIRFIYATATTPATLMTLDVNTPATGTLTTAPPGDLIIGNRSVEDNTFDGPIDFMFAGAGLWSPAGTPADLTIPEMIRSLVFQ